MHEEWCQSQTDTKGLVLSFKSTGSPHVRHNYMLCFVAVYVSFFVIYCTYFCVNCFYNSICIYVSWITFSDININTEYSTKLNGNIKRF